MKRIHKVKLQRWVGEFYMTYLPDGAKLAVLTPKRVLAEESFVIRIMGAEPVVEGWTGYKVAVRQLVVRMVCFGPEKLRVGRTYRASPLVTKQGPTMQFEGV